MEDLGPPRVPKSHLGQRETRKAVSKKRKFVKDGLFYSELNDFLCNELSSQGYAGCEVRVTPQRTEIIIRASNSMEVIGTNGKRIRELTELMRKRFGFSKSKLVCFAEKVRNKGFSALVQAQCMKYKLLNGMTVRRAASSCLQYIMDNEKKIGALGCQIIVAGKLRGQRAKGMKFRDGLLIHSGDATNYFIDTAVKHVHLPQGVIGIKVKIMKRFVENEKNGKNGVATQSKRLPDDVHILEPQEDGPPAPAADSDGMIPPPAPLYAMLDPMLEADYVDRMVTPAIDSLLTESTKLLAQNGYEQVRPASVCTFASAKLRTLRSLAASQQLTNDMAESVKAVFAALEGTMNIYTLSSALNRYENRFGSLLPTDM